MKNQWNRTIKCFKTFNNKKIYSFDISNFVAVFELNVVYLVGGWGQALKRTFIQIWFALCTIQAYIIIDNLLFFRSKLFVILIPFDSSSYRMSVVSAWIFCIFFCILPFFILMQWIFAFVTEKRLQMVKLSRSTLFCFVCNFSIILV